MILAILVTFVLAVVSVVGYLYSTGSTLNWSPKKKV